MNVMMITFLQVSSIDPFPESLDIDDSKTHLVGWSMEYLRTSLDSYKGMEKRDLILFPLPKKVPEKQVDIFRDSKHPTPQYEFVVCPRTNTKQK